ncbi:MAG: DUF6020 family protein [Butyrivibrio sp.]|nr:DUF6020 family protein [Butyrivibrio sp.]
MLNIKKLNFFGVILSFLFPLCMFLGYSYSHTNSWSLLFTNNLMRNILHIFLVIVAGFVLCILLNNFLDYIHSYKSSKRIKNKKIKNSYIFSIPIILIGWLPIIISNLPGSVPYDGMTQLLEHFGQIPHYGHHPVFITRLYGILVQLGQILINTNFGVFLVVLFQTVFCVVIFSNVCDFILEVTGSRTFYIISVLFYSLFPMFGFYVSAVLKDTFYMIVATWFSLCICKGITRKINKGILFTRKSQIISLIISGLLMCLSRKEASICVIITLLFLFLSLIKGKNYTLSEIKSIVIIVASILLINSGFNFVVFNIIGIQKGEVSEALSIPFQQTGRYVRDYEDDINDEEKAAISAILPYDELGSLYDPELSDPIKGKMNNESGTTGYVNYIKAWITMGLKHPNVYFEATLNNTYGYFYPLYKGKDLYLSSINHTQAERWGGKELDIYFLFENSAYKNGINAFYKMLTSIPILNIIFNPGFYFWIIAFLITYCIQFKIRLKSISLVLPAMTFLICFASPANGFARYAIVVYSTILLLISTILSDKKNL